MGHDDSLKDTMSCKLGDACGARADQVRGTRGRMTDPNPHEDSRVESQHESKPTTPTWVKLFGIITVVVVLLLVVLILTGHDPGRHAMGAPWNQTAPPGTTYA